MNKTIIVTGSRRKNGTSSNIARSIKEKAGSTCQIFSLAEKKVDFCTACLSCDKKRTQNCILKDDYQEFINQVEESDNIVFITPIYGGNITGTMKNFIDRTNHYFNFDKLNGKKMFLILTGCLPITGGNSSLSENEKPIERIKEFFKEYASITGCDFEYLDYFRVHPDTGNIYRDYPDLPYFIENVVEKLK